MKGDHCPGSITSPINVLLKQFLRIKAFPHIIHMNAKLPEQRSYIKGVLPSDSVHISNMPYQ